MYILVLLLLLLLLLLQQQQLLHYLNHLMIDKQSNRFIFRPISLIILLHDSCVISVLENRNVPCLFLRSMSFWSGWWDQPEEGVFSALSDAKDRLAESSFQPWYPGEPNGEGVENCGAVWTQNVAWNDDKCDNKVGRTRRGS